MNVDQYFQSASNALKASDIPPGQQARVTIEKCEEIIFKNDEGKDQPKIKMSFVGKEKGLILNKTNATTIAHVYGPDTDNWLGKEIFLFSTTVPLGDKMVDAIRINMPLEEAEEALPF